MQTIVPVLLPPSLTNSRTPGHARLDKDAANVAMAVGQPVDERRDDRLLALALAAADPHDTKRIVNGVAAGCAAHA